MDCLLARDYAVRVVDDLRGGRIDNLADALATGRVTVHENDICALEPNFAAFTGADLVLHFAGIGDIVPSVEHPVDYMNTNIMGTVRVLEASRTAGVRRFVYAASSSCYGANPPTPTPGNLSSVLGKVACS